LLAFLKYEQKKEKEEVTAFVRSYRRICSGGFWFGIWGKLLRLAL